MANKTMQKELFLYLTDVLGWYNTIEAIERTYIQIHWESRFLNTEYKDKFMLNQQNTKDTIKYIVLVLTWRRNK